MCLCTLLSTLTVCSVQCAVCSVQCAVCQCDATVHVVVSWWRGRPESVGCCMLYDGLRQLQCVHASACCLPTSLHPPYFLTTHITPTPPVPPQAKFIDTKLPGFINERKEFPKQTMAFLIDGIGIVIGSMLGTSPLTVYIESATGIKDGGRTGITAIVVAFFFFISLFFTPILASIPPFATGPALILVRS